MSLDKYSMGIVCDTMTLYAYLIGLLELNLVYCVYEKGRSILLSNFWSMESPLFSLEIDISTFMKCA